MPPAIVGNTSTLLGLLRAREKDSFKAILKGNDLDLLSLSTKEEEGYPLLQHAVIADEPELVESLLEANIDPNIGEGKKKPLLLAAEYGRHEILKQFLEFNKDEKHKSNIDFDVSALNSKKGEPKSGGENVLHLGNRNRKSLKFEYICYNIKDLRFLFFFNFSIETPSS